MLTITQMRFERAISIRQMSKLRRFTENQRFGGTGLDTLGRWMLMGIIAFIAAFGLRPAQISAQTTVTTPPIAYAARVIGDKARSRLIVDFDQKVSHRAYILNNPKRIIVDLPETVFSLDGELERLPKSLITDLRYGLIGPDRSRIVLELADPVVIENHLVRELSQEGRFRLIVDMVRATEEEFAQSVQTERNLRRAETKQSDKTSVDPVTIVLDPGHGGLDGGASGIKGTREKHITLGFSLKLKAKLEESPQYRVLMTRDDDSFIGLRDRLNFTRKQKADLLISVHADSLSQKFIRGATIYTLSKEGSDELSRILARKQNRADLIAGLELPEVESEVSDIFIDMTRRETKVFSRRFAQIMVEKMQKDVRLIKNPHRSADFFVLKAPEIPSILLELGYLSNPEDENLMSSETWQDLVAEKTANAIRHFFDDRVKSK